MLIACVVRYSNCSVFVVETQCLRQTRHSERLPMRFWRRMRVLCRAASKWRPPCWKMSSVSARKWWVHHASFCVFVCATFKSASKALASYVCTSFQLQKYPQLHAKVMNIVNAHICQQEKATKVYMFIPLLLRHTNTCLLLDGCLIFSNWIAVLLPADLSWSVLYVDLLVIS